MTDPRTTLDQIIGAMGRASLIAQLRDKVVEASHVGRRECGNCYYWMKSRDCPREQNINGRKQGPSMSAPACGKFKIEQWVLDLKAERLAEALAFAEKHNLPTPLKPVANAPKVGG